MGTKSIAKERRAEIAHGLYRCIAKRGYANTTVRDIAREAGVGLGLVTHYFESKEDILYELADHIFDRYNPRFHRRIRKYENRPPRERLKMGIRFVFMNIAGDRELNRVFNDLSNIAWYDERLQKSFKKLYGQYRREVAAFISECTKGMDVSASVVQDLAAFIVSAGEGVADQWMLDPRGTPLAKMATLAERLADMVLGKEGNDGG